MSMQRFFQRMNPFNQANTNQIFPYLCIIELQLFLKSVNKQQIKIALDFLEAINNE
jgi:hypothetical protein